MIVIKRAFYAIPSKGVPIFSGAIATWADGFLVSPRVAEFIWICHCNNSQELISVASRIWK